MPSTRFMRIKIGFVIGAVIILWVSLGWTRNNEADYLVSLALQESNLNQKIEYYKKALALDPDNPESHNNLGILYKRKSQYEQAEREYKTALSFPDYPTPEYAYYNLGVLYRTRKRYEEAVIYFKKALASEDNFPKAHNGLGLTYKAQWDYQQARRSFQKAVELDPGYEEAKRNLDTVWRLPEVPQLEQEAEKLYRKGKILEENSQLEQAEAAFKQVLKLIPGHTNAKTALAQLQEKYKNVSKTTSAGHLTKAKQAGSGQPDGAKKPSVRKLYQEGIQHLEMDEWLEAISCFTQILIQDPNNKNVQEKNKQAKINYYYQQALEQQRAEHWDVAETLLRNLLTLDPEYAPAKDRLAEVQEGQKQKQIKGLLTRAETNMELGAWAATKQHLRSVLKLDPQNETAHRKMAEMKQQVINKNPWHFLPNFKNPLSLLSLAIILIALYLIFSKVLRPSKVFFYYHKYKEYDRMRVVYENILERDSKRRVVFAPLASIYHGLNQHSHLDHLIELARENLLQADNDDAPLWHLSLGEIYRELSDYEQAKEEMEIAHRLAPINQEIQYKLVALYELLIDKSPSDPYLEEELTRLRENITQETAAPQETVLPETPVQETVIKEPQAPVSPSPTTQAREEQLELLRECFGRSKA